MDLEDEMQEQIAAISTPVYALTKEDLIKYYKKEYPGNWQRHLSEDLAPIAGAKPASIARRFQPKRIDQAPSLLAQLQYEELGYQIGPIEWIPPENGYELTFVGEIKISDGCWPRAFTVHIPPDEAYKFANDVDINIAIAIYANGLFGAEGYCKHPEVEISAA